MKNFNILTTQQTNKLSYSCVRFFKVKYHYLAYLLDIHGDWLGMANINIEMPALTDLWTHENCGPRAEYVSIEE